MAMSEREMDGHSARREGELGIGRYGFARYWRDGSPDPANAFVRLAADTLGLSQHREDQFAQGIFGWEEEIPGDKAHELASNLLADGIDFLSEAAQTRSFCLQIGRNPTETQVQTAHARMIPVAVVERMRNWLLGFATGMLPPEAQIEQIRRLFSHPSWALSSTESITSREREHLALTSAATTLTLLQCVETSFEQKIGSVLADQIAAGHTEMGILRYSSPIVAGRALGVVAGVCSPIRIELQGEIDRAIGPIPNDLREAIFTDDSFVTEHYGKSVTDYVLGTVMRSQTHIL